MTNTALIDGVPTDLATATELASFKLADQQLNGFVVPKLYDPANPHVRVFYVLSDGTGNDANNKDLTKTNIGLLKSQLETIQETNPSIGVGYLAGPGTQGGPLGLLDSITGGKTHWGQVLQCSKITLISPNGKTFKTSTSRRAVSRDFSWRQARRHLPERFRSPALAELAGRSLRAPQLVMPCLLPHGQPLSHRRRNR